MLGLGRRFRWESGRGARTGVELEVIAKIVLDPFHAMNLFCIHATKHLR